MELRNKKVIVSGATGFIGRNLIPILVDKGYEVIVIGRNINKAKSFDWFNDIRFITYDLNDKNELKRIDGANGLIHLAWQGLQNYDSSIHSKINSPNSYRFIKSLLNKGIKQILVSGSCAEYGYKKGYSKFGSFIGNQSTDGTFIYTGFRPAWIMFKESTGSESGANWFMYDNKRSTFNQTQKYLRANLSNDEQDNSAGAIDILSNGFKIRTADTSLNDNGETYIFMAFAESPFVNSNGVPTNAR